ncbi:hypothetical protein P355_2851 [Burkholderia cenocepacia KC-01]|nr:hypothetical protein P355_2851 [Burkholderia cenocepacia KC-01]
MPACSVRCAHSHAAPERHAIPARAGWLAQAARSTALAGRIDYSSKQFSSYRPIGTTRMCPRPADGPMHGHARGSRLCRTAYPPRARHPVSSDSV